MKLYVDLGKNSYLIYIENGILDEAAEHIAKVFSGKKIMLISDDNVYALYGENLKSSLSAQYECYELIIPHGEESKSFHTLPAIYTAMLKAKISRSDLVVALGGGVIGDLAGYAAASYLRGISFVQIPTSLLAQVDSSVGGKVAVDLLQGKNLVGAFYQPSLVLIDPLVLNTLPERFIHDGMGEVIKYGCIKDADLFGVLEGHSSFDNLKEDLPDIICRCVDIKRAIVEEDPFDTGQRMLLNFGHTLAHTIEQYFQYGRESHGEAVAIGMYQIMRLAEEREMAPEGISERIRKVLEKYRLPYECGLPLADLMEAVALDKKNLGGKLNIILLHATGDAYIYPTSTDFFTKGTEGRII